MIQLLTDLVELGELRTALSVEAVLDAFAVLFEAEVE
jgi:hypothetical protein